MSLFMSSTERQIKYNSFNKPVKFMKFYMSVLLPLQFFFSLVGIFTGYFDNTYTSYIIFVSDIIYCGWAAANYIFIRDLDKIGFFATIGFIIYQCFRVVYVCIYGIYEMSSILENANPKSMFDIFFNQIASSMTGFFKGIIILSVLFMCVIYTLMSIYFFKRKNLFFKSAEELTNNEDDDLRIK